MFELLLVAADLHLHLGPQLAIEIGERLVEQQQRRARDQAARQRHALLLAARELVRIALLQPFQLQEPQRPGQPLVAARALRTRLHAQRKDDVLRHGLVREEQEVLEHHADMAAVGRQAGDVLPADRPPAPRSGRSSPAMMRSSVVLPEPLGPSRAKNSSCRMSRSTPSTAFTGPKRLVTDPERERR